MKKKVCSFLLKTLVFIIPVPLVFELLFHLGFSPIITNSTLFDFKMMEVQKHHIRNARLLAIGSSITLYEFNSDVLMQNIPISYYNFGSWGLQVSDMRVLLKDFVQEYHPRYIIIGSSFGDFVNGSNDTYQNYVNTNSFIKQHLPEYFYFKNYNSLYQVIRRKYKSYPVKFDQWGGTSLTVKQPDFDKDKQELHDIVFPTSYTNYQYRELTALSSFLKKQNIKLIFVQAPLRQSYRYYPSSQQKMLTHINRCKAIVEHDNGTFLNYATNPLFKNSLFVDQYHLQLSGAIIFTKLLVKDLKPLIK